MMVKFLIIFSILLSTAYMREKDPSSPFFEIDCPAVGLFDRENSDFQLLDEKVKAVVEGPYVKIQSIYTYNNYLDSIIVAKFRFPQVENDIFHRVEIKHEKQDVAVLLFDELNSPNKEYVKVDSFTNERYSYKEIPTDSLKAYETVKMILTVLRPLKVQLNQFYEFSIRPNHVPGYTIFSPYYFQWNYNLQVELKSESPFAILANPTHQVQPVLSNSTDSLSGVVTHKAFYNLKTIASCIFSREFKIYFASSDFKSPQRIMATHPFNPHNHVFMFSLIPDMNYFPFLYYWDRKSYFMQDIVQPILSNLSDPENFSKLRNATILSDLDYFPNEYLFVIDQSDSMKGPRFENLRKTLNKLLEYFSKSGSFYSILSFGNSSQLHWKKPEDGNPYKTPQDTTEIMKWVETLEANMDEKDLLSALKYVFEEYEWTSLPRNVVILTDGEISNMEEVLQLITTNSNSQKICALEIDEDSKEILRKIGEAGGCQTEFRQRLGYWNEESLMLMEATLTSPRFNLAYEIKCLDEPGFVVYQEEGSFDGIPKDKAFIKWVTLNNIPNLKSCKAKIFYYSQHRCSSFSEEIDIFRSRKAEISDAWQKVAQHAKLYEEHLSKEAKRSLMVNNSQTLSHLEPFESQEVTKEGLHSDDQSHYQRSQYDIYQEQFYSLKCYDPKRPLLSGVALSKPFSEGDENESYASQIEEREDESIFSFKITCIASVCTLLFIAGLFIVFK